MWLIFTIAFLATTGEPYLAICGRSPIPQPGEAFTAPLSYTRLASPDAPESVVAGEIIPWHRAPRHLGQTVTLEGTIVSTHRLPHLTFLNFHENWRGQFYIVVFDTAHNDNFHPETEYLHQTLQITGKVTLHKNRPQVQVRDLSQIKVLPP